MPRKKKPPKIIQEVGFNFRWDEEKVWELDLPVEKMHLKKLEWHFEIPFWWTKGGFYDFKPIWVINNPKKYPNRYKRIMNSDMNYPIDIMRWNSRWVILDGLHRLTKSAILGNKEVDVRKVSRKYIPKIKK